jgi:hypothetical protein
MALMRSYRSASPEWLRLIAIRTRSIWRPTPDWAEFRLSLLLHFLANSRKCFSFVACACCSDGGVPERAHGGF